MNCMNVRSESPSDAHSRRAQLEAPVRHYSSSKYEERPLNEIRNIDVSFPFEPYPPQRIFIERLIEALQTAENALLESPTGTGKTMCLLTGALAWQEAYVAAAQHVEMVKRSGRPPELEPNYARHLAAAGKLTQPPVPSFPPGGGGSGSSSSAGLVLPNRAYTYADGAGASAAPGPGLAGTAPTRTRIPRILYASRTHSQLSQVVKELKRSGYAPKMAVLGAREQLCTNPRVSKMSGNAQLHACRQLGKARRCGQKLGLDEWLLSDGALERLHVTTAVGHAQVAEAYEAAASGSASGSSGSGSAGLTSSASSSRRAHTGHLMDIEELAAMGRERTLCSFYLGRTPAVQAQAELLLVPYNYLIDPAVRGQTFGPEFEWHDSVVIFDEAHNVEENAASAASIELSAGTLALAIKELTAVLKPLTSTEKAHQVLLSSVIETSDEFGQRLRESVDDIGALGFDPNDAYQLQVKLRQLEMDINSLGTGAGEWSEGPLKAKADSLQLPIVGLALGALVFQGEMLYCLLERFPVTYENKSQVCALLDGVIAHMASQDALGGGGKGLYGLENFKQLLERAFRSPTMRTHQSHYYRLLLAPAASSSSGGGGRSGSSSGVLSAGKPQEGRNVSFVCFSPAVAMRELKSLGVRSIILASGTLSPMESYASELQLPFKVRLENPHVVSARQVLIGTVSKGPTGKVLSSTFSNRSTIEYKKELAGAIINFLQVIPDGVLVFFPSYSVMDSCVAFWRADNGGELWRRIERAKQCAIMEDKSPGAFAEQIKSYNAAVAGGRGAVLFAVCRGKASEGIDFSDATGRGVLVTGIPYPNAVDTKVILKRRYLDEARSAKTGLAAPVGAEAISGQQWYLQQAFRAVNQAIGRVIRHRTDYGAILLLDERFSKAEERSCVSSWLRNSIQDFAHAGAAHRDVAQFFRENKEGAIQQGSVASEQDKFAALSASIQASRSAADTPVRPFNSSNLSIRQPYSLASNLLLTRVPRQQAKEPAVAAARPVDLFTALTAPKERKTEEQPSMKISSSEGTGSASRDDHLATVAPSRISQPRAAVKSAFGLNQALKSEIEHDDSRSSMNPDTSLYLSEVRSFLGEKYDEFRKALKKFKITNSSASEVLRLFLFEIGASFSICTTSGTLLINDVSTLDRRIELFKSFLPFVPEDRRAFAKNIIQKLVDAARDAR